jgi:hypothetical protein
MTSRATISSQEAADRLAIREQNGQWLFAERRLMVNWTETRPSAA